MRRVAIGFTVCFFLASNVTLVGQQSDDRPPIRELLSLLQQHYATLEDFSATFEHNYSGGLLQVSQAEFGTVSIKKPGRWRFDYERPEHKIFVSDTRTVYSVFPDDRQVIISEAPTERGASTPALFLAGEGNLTTDFTADYALTIDIPTPHWVIHLQPIRTDADYEYLTLTIDPENLEIRQMATTDFQGGTSTYTFTKFKINTNLTDNFFTFDVPSDFEVMRDDVFTR